MTSAAIAAGYSPKVAAEVACENLKKSNIQERIDRAILRAGVTPEEIIGTLAQQMHADIADLLNDNGEFDYKLACERSVTGQIKKLKIKDGFETTYEIELYSAQDAARSLADICGLKQQPRENEQDARRKREWAEQQLQLVMERIGFDREAALQWMRENTPSAALWVN